VGELPACKGALNKFQGNPHIRLYNEASEDASRKKKDIDCKLSKKQIDYCQFSFLWKGRNLALSADLWIGDGCAGHQSKRNDLQKVWTEKKKKRGGDMIVKKRYAQGVCQGGRGRRGGLIHEAETFGKKKAAITWSQ